MKLFSNAFIVSKFRRKPKLPLSLDVMMGPNTNQLWVYDNTNDVFIDPPAEVLDRIDAQCNGSAYHDYENGCRLLEKEIASNPEWLYETDHWYRDLEP